MQTPGQIEKEKGITLVLSNADDLFKHAYAEIFEHVLKNYCEFDAEIVRDEFNLSHPDLEPHHHNCWGAIFSSHLRRNTKAGRIEFTNKYVPHVRASSHARIKRIYRSLVTR